MFTLVLILHNNYMDDPESDILKKCVKILLRQKCFTILFVAMYANCKNHKPYLYKNRISARLIL